jgi:hypothetical protein
MALVLKDRVKETTTTTGTGTITLAGASSGFQSFSTIGNANTTYYTIAGGTEWEVGLGTYTSSGNTLSRDTVLESSNGGSLVNFSAGTKDVFVTYPAEKSIYQNASSIANITSLDVTTALGYTPGTANYPGAGIAVSTGSAWTTSLTAPSGAIVGTTDTQTLSAKTLTGTKETVFAITDGAAFEIDPANGGIQTITLGASRTPKGTNFTAGQSVTLMINDGTAYTITWTDATFGTGGVIWVGGTAPTLATTGFTVIELWEVGTQVYGALVGNVA